MCMKPLNKPLFIIFTILFFPYSLFISPMIWAFAKKHNRPWSKLKNRWSEDDIEQPAVVKKVATLNNWSGQLRADQCEKQVSEQLKTLDSNSYTIINNVTIPSTGNTTNTQIDHIVVSRYGVFCIETKSHAGCIFGSDDRRYWVQSLYGNNNKFYSPLRQNFAHTQSLNSLLGDKLNQQIIPIVVFPNAYFINIESDKAVGNIKYMMNEITKHEEILYETNEYGKIINSIMIANKKDNQTANQHKVEVNNLVASLSL